MFSSLLGFFNNIGAGVQNAARGIANTVGNVYNSVANTISPYLTGQTAGGATLPKSPNSTFSPTISNAPGQVVPQVYPGSTGAGSSQNVSPAQYAYVPAPITAKSGTRTADTSSLSYSPLGSSGPNSFMVSQPVPTSITSGAITGVPPINLTPSAPTVPKNYVGTATMGNVAVGADPATGIFLPPNAQTKTNPDGTINTTYNPQGESDKAFNDYITSLKAPPSATDAYNKAVQQTGLLQAQQQKLNTQNRVNAITSKMNTDLLQLRGTAGKEGVTEAVYGGQQAEITREATIQLLPLQAQLAVDQGNLELATSNTDTLFKIYADDAKNSVDFYNNGVKAAWDFFNDKEKKQATDLLWQKNFNADIVKTDASKQADVANKLLEAGNVKAYQAITSVRIPSNVNSPTFAQDYQKYKSDLANTVSKYGDTFTGADAAVSPDVLQGMLNVYKSTGVLPAFGLSAKSPLRAQFYAALGGAGGNQIISDANLNKSVRSGLSTAYKTQQNILSANQTAIGTLDQQLNLAQQYSDKVNRSGSPLVNKYLLATKSGVFGDPDTAALHNIVTTASYELAKIISGSAASISGVTVNSAQDAANLLNSAMSKGQFNEVLGLMKKEAQFRLTAQQDTLTQLKTDIENVGSLVNDVKDPLNVTTTTITNNPLGI